MGWISSIRQGLSESVSQGLETLQEKLGAVEQKIDRQSQDLRQQAYAETAHAHDAYSRQDPRGRRGCKRDEAFEARERALQAARGLVKSARSFLSRGQETLSESRVPQAMEEPSVSTADATSHSPAEASPSTPVSSKTEHSPPSFGALWGESLDFALDWGEAGARWLAGHIVTPQSVVCVGGKVAPNPLLRLGLQGACAMMIGLKTYQAGVQFKTDPRIFTALKFGLALLAVHRWGRAIDWEGGFSVNHAGDSGSWTLDPSLAFSQPFSEEGISFSSSELGESSLIEGSETISAPLPFEPMSGPIGVHQSYDPAPQEVFHQVVGVRDSSSNIGGIEALFPEYAGEIRRFFQGPALEGVMGTIESLNLQGRFQDIVGKNRGWLEIGWREALDFKREIPTNDINYAANADDYGGQY